MSGYLKSKQTLTAEELSAFSDQLQSEGFQVVRALYGVSVDFEDGCDAWIVKEGEHGRLAEDESKSGDLAEALAEFHRLNDIRRRVLWAVRRVARAKGVRLKRSKSGQWDTQFLIGTSYVMVAAGLTRLALSHDAATTLHLLLDKQWGLQVTSEEAMEWVQQTAPVEGDLPWKEDHEVVGLFGAGLAAMDCSQLDCSEILEAMPEEKRLDALLPHRGTPGQKVLESLTDKIGPSRLSFNFTQTHVALFAFDDKLSSFHVVPQGKRLKRLIEQHGVEGTVEILYNDFTVLNRERATAIKLVQATVAQAGYYQDSSPFHSKWYFGRRHREYSFSHGRDLTYYIKNHGAVEHVRRWLKESRICQTIPTCEELEALTASSTAPLPPRRTLPIDEPGPALYFPEISPSEARRLDERARAILEEAKQQAFDHPGERCWFLRDPLWCWCDTDYYRRGIDTWVDEAWWLSLARRATNHQGAEVILLVNGQRDLITQSLARMAEFDHWEEEAFDHNLLWQLADQVPWPFDENAEYPDYSLNQGPTPIPLARRRAILCREALALATTSADPESRWTYYNEALGYLAGLDPQNAEIWLTTTERSQLRFHCEEWAAQTDLANQQLSVEPLAAAAVHGWAHINRLLDANPTFFSNYNSFAAQCRLMGNLALRVSNIAADSFAKRVAGYTLSTVEDQSTNGVNPYKNIKGIGAEKIEEMQQRSRANESFAAAIAWQRCRASGG